MTAAEFYEVLRRVCAVHMYDTGRRIPTSKQRYKTDAGCKRARTIGSGTPADPYRYAGDLRCSSHFAAIDLWCAYRPGPSSPEVFARIGELYVILTHQGIRALDGRVSRLAP